MVTLALSPHLLRYLPICSQFVYMYTISNKVCVDLYTPLPAPPLGWTERRWDGLLCCSSTGRFAHGQPTTGHAQAEHYCTHPLQVPIDHFVSTSLHCTCNLYWNIECPVMRYLQFYTLYLVSPFLASQSFLWNSLRLKFEIKIIYYLLSTPCD